MALVEVMVVIVPSRVTVYKLALRCAPPPPPLDNNHSAREGDAFPFLLAVIGLSA